ncbi:hypothetical protein HLV35_07560 [Eggerthellaceae bacterium zg-997]|nr:hypothetical protein [Eggerthellaceae bacterium zg-997]
MAKRDGYTRYACDRCGEVEYLAAGDGNATNWREVSRVTADGIAVTRILCARCLSGFKPIAARHDTEFADFMAKRGDE